MWTWIIFHVCLLPSSEFIKSRYFRVIVIVVIANLGCFCGNLWAPWSTLHDLRPHIIRCINGDFFTIRFYSFDDFLQIWTVISDMKAIPRAAITWVGYYFYPHSLVEFLRNFFHYLIHLRFSTFISTREDVDICWKTNAYSID